MCVLLLQKNSVQAADRVTLPHWVLCQRKPGALSLGKVERGGESESGFFVPVAQNYYLCGMRSNRSVVLTLFRRELTAFLVSSVGWIVLTVWLLSLGCMLWVFGGDYNLLDGGYATLRPLFELSPVLMILIVPAITMRSYAEEWKTGTFELLVSQPVSLRQILAAKYMASWTVMLLAVVLTLFYVVTLNLIALQGVDAGEVAGGYIGLLFLSGVFVSIGLFSSSLTKNPVTAYVLGLFFSFLFYYGFSLIASLTNKGELHATWEKVGMKVWFEPMTHGVISSGGVLYFVLVALLFLETVLWRQKRAYGLKKWKKIPWGLVLFAGVGVFALAFSLRWDLTEEKRYTLSPHTRRALESLEQKPEVILYLNGALNPEFQRLHRTTVDLLREMAGYTKKGMRLTLVDPSGTPDAKEREERYLSLSRRGITGLSVNTRDAAGNVTAQVLFPWAELVYEGDTLPVSLLRRDAFRAPQELLQASYGELEYGFADAFRILTTHSPKRIVFIEGHGELEEPALYEAFTILSRYYSIDRGELGNDPSALAPYKALVIAGPQTPFTEQEKFVLDQYVMGGGNVFLLTEGTRFNQQEFDATGESPTLKRELNLDDLLFTYGARIEPVTLQDLQCTSITLTASSGVSGTPDQTVTLPWFFAPLLLPSKQHVLTTSLSPLKSEYVSPVTFVNPRPGVRKTILFATSEHTHSLPVPEKISLRYVEMPATESYFNEPAQPVIVWLEGTLPSVYANRLAPAGCKELPGGRLLQSRHSRLLIAGTASILKNEWEGSGRNVRPVPLGYDRNSRTLLGNEDFLVQSVSYLMGDEKWVSLRGRIPTMRLLNQEAVTLKRTLWQVISVGSPCVFLFLFLFVFRGCRKKRFLRIRPF